MSTFGDHTAQQDLLEWTEMVQRDYDLTKEEIVIVMISVLQQINDPYEAELYRIRKEKHKEGY